MATAAAATPDAAQPTATVGFADQPTASTTTQGATTAYDDADPLLKQQSEDNKSTLPPLVPPVNITLPPDQEQVVLASGQPMRSILKNSKFKKQQSVKMPLQRRDTQGKDISNGQRFKIAFRDKVQNQSQISDTFLVESYKKYNAQEVDEDTTICKCAIF